MLVRRGPYRGHGDRFRGTDEEAIELSTATGDEHGVRRHAIERAASGVDERGSAGVNGHDVGVEEGGGVDGIDDRPDVPASSSPCTSTTITPFARDTWTLVPCS
jgi:hypothetical protein